MIGRYVSGIVFLTLGLWLVPLPVFAGCSVSGGVSNDGNSGFGSNNQDMAFQFTPGCSGYVTEVVAKMTRQGSPTDQAKIEIQTDSGGLPSGTILATSPGVTLSTTEPVYADVTFTWSTTSAAVSSGVTYHAVSKRTQARDNTNYFNWAFDSDTSSGIFEYTDPNPATWNNLNNRSQLVTITISDDPPSGGGGGTTSSSTSTDDLFTAWNRLYFGLYITFVISMISTIYIWRRFVC